jgi:hypothetical protein
MFLLRGRSKRWSRSARGHGGGGWWAKPRCAAAAALLWRRRLAMSGGVAPQELLGSPRWPPWMGTAAAGRRTDGGRWPETTRGVIRHSPQLGGCHLANKARRAFVLMGHSFAFARQSGVCGSGWRTNGAGLYKRQYAQTCDLRYFETPRSVGRRQRQRPGSSFLGSCLCVPMGC